MVLPHITFPVVLLMLVSTSIEQTLETLSTDITTESNVESENCKNIHDYEPCLKNTCPENMPCYCNEEKEYCRCNNFKGPLGDYWRLGSKCEQQWNTYDLILVAVLPGVSLTLIVAVCMHCVYSHKKRKYIEKARKRLTDGKEFTQKKAISKHSAMNIHHQNEAFVNDESSDEDLRDQQQNTHCLPRKQHVNIPHVDQMKYFHDTEVRYGPTLRSNQPESDLTKVTFSPPVPPTCSSYEADQRFNPPYNQRDNGMVLPTLFKRPEIKGIQVLPPIATRPSFKEEYPGNQHFQHHSGYTRPQY